MKSILVRADIPDDKEDRKDLVTNGLESGITRFILRKGDERFEDLGLMDAVYFDNGVPCTEGFALVTISVKAPILFFMPTMGMNIALPMIFRI